MFDQTEKEENFSFNLKRDEISIYISNHSERSIFPTLNNYKNQKKHLDI